MTPPPARTTVVPLPVTSQASPRRGSKFDWNLKIWLFWIIPVGVPGAKLPICPLASLSGVSPSQRSPRFKISLGLIRQSSCAKNAILSEVMCRMLLVGPDALRGRAARQESLRAGWPVASLNALKSLDPKVTDAALRIQHLGSVKVLRADVRTELELVRATRVGDAVGALNRVLPVDPVVCEAQLLP